MNWVFYMNGAARDPIQSGDFASWFFHYKWGVGGEVWLPITALDVPGGGHISPGDHLWLLLIISDENRQLLGFATVLRTEENHTTGMWEIWYDDDKVRRVPPTKRSPAGFPGWCTNENVLPVPDYIHTEWLERLNAPSS